MASVVFIVGKSGTGKSTAGKTLDPKTNLWINCDQKDLPFKGWMGKYNKESKNYLKSSTPIDILHTFQSLTIKAPHIETVVIDTVNRIMTDKMMNERTVQNYGKWTDLAGVIYDLVQYANKNLPDNLTIFFLAHMDTGYTDTGVMYRQVQTMGQQLNKISLESMSTIVLFTSVKHNNGKNEYFFETQTDGISTAKSPEGMFEEFLIPNDLKLVHEQVKNYKLIS